MCEKSYCDSSIRCCKKKYCKEHFGSKKKICNCETILQMNATNIDEIYFYRSNLTPCIKNGFTN